jgi:hypothetical protein
VERHHARALENADVFPKTESGTSTPGSVWGLAAVGHPHGTNGLPLMLAIIGGAPSASPPTSTCTGEPRTS